MSNDLFDAKNVDPALDPEKDYFAELVGEGKRYKDERALARARLEADRHLARIEQENAGLRQELQNRMKLEDIVDTLSKPRTDPVQTPDPVVTPEPPKQFDIEALLEQKLTEREKQKKRDENFAAVQTAMARAFGPNYVEVLKQKAQEMGTSPQRFNELALTEPEFLLKLVGAENTPAPRGNDLFTPPPASHAPGFKPANTERNKAYYDKIKKDNPVLYWSKETQMAMHKDADKLGERFFV